MKKFLLSLILASQIAFSAISINVQWDVRTTGNDSNGGGFVAGASGTDFSVQDAAQFSGTNLASANGTTNPCVVTSATHNFVAADVGNIINISAGTNWTTGWYQIVSVAANAATLDRNCGSVAALSAGTWAEGGGFATLGQAVTVTNASVDGAGGTIDGTINVKTGTYTLTSVIAPNVNYGIIWVGYGTAHGDNGTAPTITTATNSTNLFNLGGSTHYFDNFTFTNTAVTPAIGINQTAGNQLIIRNSSFSGFTNAISASSTFGSTLVGVEIKNSTGAGFNNGTLTCIACYIHNNTGNGIFAGTATIINSIISNNSIGMFSSASPGSVACINSDVANNSSDGIRATVSNIVLNNCVIYGNGGFGVNGPGTAGSNIAPINLGRNNAYGGNTSGNLTGFTSAPGVLTGNSQGLGDVTLTANPFTSATNFALNSTAGGGAAINTQGFPGTFPGGLTIGTQAVGGVQNSSGGGGGGSSLFTIIYVK